MLERQSYVLLGKQPLEIIDRLAFILNGVVWVDRKNREDKKKAVIKMKKLLKAGANLIIFPEGTWNLTPSKPMLPLYWGVIDIAKDSCKPIIPIVLEYTDSKCYVAFGDIITIPKQADKGESIDKVSDSFATLKWTIWERFDDIGYDTLAEWDAEVHKRVAEYPKLDYEYEKSIVRKDVIE
ncbi:MAG: 1-acyl-sn-glycerol-3-phosphate acyltransferase [Lachnospiraceae bacterium]|nr:1-acyl-sn-glycerol-3-phosphate acyltransferase [Lachnospiraceae bacterium]